MNNQCLYVACSRCGQILKELTDEEIAEAKKLALKQYYAVNDCAVIQTADWFDKLFTEAILRKAQEK